MFFIKGESCEIDSLLARPDVSDRTTVEPNIAEDCNVRLRCSGSNFPSTGQPNALET